MTNRIAIVLGLLLIAAMVLDGYIYGNEHLIFLGKKLISFCNCTIVFFLSG